MYNAFYSIKKEAFAFQLDPELFYHSRQHKEAWYFLAYNFKMREPFILLFGNHGTGKTTLCLKLVDALKKKDNVSYVYIQSPNYSYAHILKKITQLLAIEVQDERDEQSMQDIIYNYAENLSKPVAPDKIINIIIDDVHDMQLDTLRKLRMLANFYVDGVFPFRFIFFAHTSFVNTLKNSQLLALHQRIRRRFHLEPFDAHDTRDYIYFRLNKAGAPNRKIFTDDAVLAVFNYTRGIPRLINVICDVSLMLGAANRAVQIDRAIVDEAFKRCQGMMRKQNHDQDQANQEKEQQVYADQPGPEKRSTAKVQAPQSSPVQQKGPQQISLEPDIQQDKEAAPQSINLKRQISMKSLGIYLLIFIIGFILAIVLDLGGIIKDF